ncbi:Shedu anti-phage system protein SduA domain-containing protein [Micromonospora noduli]|uniref:Shedu anti-phage system protein SduA domain-containing protein n=1 Tax=Micromonospora noduli TaxID=709876 RepID=UPI001788A766|nr:Shedu anti-phage system protein SduA domain-containing protein [Micromonospora noduli]
MAQWLLTTGDTRLHRSQQAGFPGETWVTSDCLGDAHVFAPLAEGDGVALRRAGRGGGIVAHGRVEAVLSAHGDPPESRFERCSPHQVTVVFDELFLGRPIEREWLRASTAPASYAFASTRRGSRRPVEISDEAWRAIVRLALENREIWWPARWDMPVGTVVSRTDLYLVFGGQKTATVSDSESTPNTFIFTTLSPADAGSSWSDDGAFLVTGAAETDMSFSYANDAVAKHVRRGRPLRVFRSSRGGCTYLGEFVVDQAKPVERWVMTGRERVVAARYSRRGPGQRQELRAPIFRLFPLGPIAPLQSGPARRQQRLRVSVELGRHTAGTAPDGAPGPEQPAGDPQSAGTAPVTAAVEKLLAVLRMDPAAADAFAETDAAALLADLLERRVRWAAIAELRDLIDDPRSRENAIQRVLERNTWMFGGFYIGKAARRKLTLREQLDIPLIRADGSLHGVELKTARIEDLVVEHRNRLIVGPLVNEAVGQVINYLDRLDQQQAVIQSDLKVDCRRAAMTVVIGHPRYVTCGASAAEVAETIRTYNTHLTRVQVMTYKDLIDSAERALRLAQA